MQLGALHREPIGTVCEDITDDYLQRPTSDYTASCRDRQTAGRAYGLGTLQEPAYSVTVVSTGPTGDVHNTTHNPKIGVYPDRVQQHTARLCTISTLHSTQHTGCRLAIPIRRAVHSSLKATRRTIPNVVQSMNQRSQLDPHDTLNVPARVPIA